MSDNLEPIELKFLVNSPEFMEEFQKMMSTVKNYDASVDSSKKKFSEFISHQMKGLSVLDENAKLTEKQALALQRHADTIDFVKEKMNGTFDPTQLGVYNFQLESTQKAINAIIESANKNIQLMSPEEIEIANQKLNDALNLLDKISDTHVSSNIANPEELEVLSNEINKTEDGFQQLATVIDFVKAKISGMDQGSEDFKQLEADIVAANELLGRTPQLYDANGNSINQMNDALKHFQEQLSSATDPSEIQILNQNIETLEKGIQKTKNAGKGGFDEFGNKIEDQKEKTVSLQTELENLVNKMARLRLANKEGSEEYEILKNKAVETRTAITATNQEIGTGVKNTANLQGLINITQNIAAGYGVINGAVGLFNSNQEESQKIIQKVTSVLAVLQSLQQIQVALNTKDAATTALLTNSKNLLSAATLRVATALGISTVAAQAFMTLGLSLVVSGLIYVFNNWTTEIEKNADKQRQLSETASKGAGEMLAKYKALQIQYQSLNGETAKQEKFIKDNASAFNDLGYKVENVNDAEKFFISQSNNVIQSLLARAEATAALQLATEKYQEALVMDADLIKENATYKENAATVRIEHGIKNFFGFGSTEERKKEAEADALLYATTYNNKLEKSLQDSKKTGLKTTEKKTSSFAWDDDIKKQMDQLDVMKARGTNADAFERALFNTKLQRYKNDKEKFAEIVQQKALFEARVLKQQDDVAKQSSDKRQREAEAAQKKAQRLAEQFAEAQKQVREKISAAEENLSNKETEGDELAAIKKRYAALRAEANKVKLAQSDIMRIDLAEKKETGIKQYEIETKDLVKNLNRQKELYTAYETFKTTIAQSEFAKRNNLKLEEFETFSQLINEEIKKLTEKAELTAAEKERLKAFQNIKIESDTSTSQEDFKKFEKAVQDTITHRERLEGINKEFSDRELQLQKIADENLRNTKLAENEKQKQDAINAANDEAFQRSEIFRRLSENLIEISKSQLKARIEALKTILAEENILTDAQRTEFERKLKEAESIKSNSTLQQKINERIAHRKNLEEAAAKAVKENRDLYIKLQEDIAAVNEEINSLEAEKWKEAAEWAKLIKQTFSDLASMIGDSNEGLADTLSTISEIADIAGNLANSIGGILEGIANGFTKGGVIGIVQGFIGAIGGLFSLGKKARESERKAQEEMKKYQESIFQSQLDYNAELRKRIADEVKLNDLYKSRVDNIKEEIEANKKNAAQILKDQQEVFNRLLKAQTVAGMHTEKYGGFLGIGRKTKAVEELKSVAELLGIGKYVDKTLFGGVKIKIFEPGQVELTDELFDKLEKLNATKPLTGDAKLAYDQLKKLRDEYGSIAEANRQLEIQLKNALTGTTAQALADSIREGLKSGKKSFADFADDIEGFLREAVLAGISAKMIEPKIQELQDALADMMGDGILSQEEREKFNQMYMAIVNSSQEYMDIINQAGVNLVTGSSNANSLSGALKGASQESIDLLSGHTMGMKLTQIETNTILKNGFAQQLQQTSESIAIQIDIEQNTRRTADNTEKIYDVNDNVVKVVDGQDKYYKALQAAGIIK